MGTERPSDRPPHQLGLVGAGDVVERFWSPTIAGRPWLRLSGVVSAGGQSAERVAARHGAAAVSNYRELLENQETETILVVSPPHTHLEVAAAALEAGKNVLVEKPLCANVADARALLEKGRQAAGIFSVTFNNRYREANAWVHDQVLAGAVGAPRIVGLRWWRQKSLLPEPWRADPNCAFGGVLADLGSHLLCLGLAALPERKAFSARCWIAAEAGGPSRIDHRADAEVRIDGQVSLYVSTAWGASIERPVDFVFEVAGTDGIIAASDFTDPSGDGYDALLDDFMRAVDENRQPDLDLFEDVMILLDAVYRAAEVGEEVEGRFAAFERQG